MESGPVSYTHLDVYKRQGWGTDEIEEANFYVSDAAQLDSVIAEVQKISSINWNNFNITANDEVYQNISSALSDTGTLITTCLLYTSRCV